MKKKIISFFIIVGFCYQAQCQYKQDIGINMAGLLIKNEATIVPALFYRYSIKNYQIRTQLALQGKIDSRNRNGNFNNGGSFGNFTQDSVIKYDPGRNVRYGLMIGIQKNTPIESTGFTYYYGLDLIFIFNDFYQSGEGTILQGNGGFDTTKQRINIKIKEKNKLFTYGIGLPIGLTYKFGTRFYSSLEAKFIIAYQLSKISSSMETSQVQNFQFFTSKTENINNSKGLDFGIKPLTGLCIGMMF